VDLDVPAADLDLWHGRDTRHRSGEVWQNHVASAELVGEDATAGADIDILPEFVNKAERRSLLGDCRRDGNKNSQASESKAKHYVAHVSRDFHFGLPASGSIHPCASFVAVESKFLSPFGKSVRLVHFDRKMHSPEKRRSAV